MLLVLAETIVLFYWKDKMEAKKKIWVQAANQISIQQPLCDDWMDAPMVYSEPYTRSIDPDFKPYVSPVEGRRMGKLLKRALAVSLQTLRDAQVEQPDAIITGTGLGSVESTEAFLLDMCENGEQLLKPTHFMQSTHNTIGSLVAIQTHCHGYNATYSHKQISFESALYDAWLQLQMGHIQTALVGGHDAMTPNYFHLLELAGYVGNGMKGTSGEASMAALLSSVAPATTQQIGSNCQLVGVKLLHRPSDEQWKKALADLSIPASAVLFGGENGLPANDDLYAGFRQKFLPGVTCIPYKQWFGECFTSSALGFYAATQYIRHNRAAYVLLVTLNRTGDAALVALQRSAE